MGWFLKIENLLVWDGFIVLWKLFFDFDLLEVCKDYFKSLYDCFMCELKLGLWLFDLDFVVVVSFLDGIVGVYGRIVDIELF